MSKRRIYTGTCKVYNKTSHPADPAHDSNRTMVPQKIKKTFMEYTWLAFMAVVDNYAIIVTVAIVVFMSLLFPICKSNKSNKLYIIKKVLDHLTVEVKRAEVACITAIEDLRCLKHSLCDQQTETTQELQELSISTSSGLLTKRPEPLQVEKKIGFFRRFFTLKRNISKKEIAIMSLVYTDSFDHIKL